MAKHFHPCQLGSFSNKLTSRGKSRNIAKGTARPWRDPWCFSDSKDVQWLGLGLIKMMKQVGNSDEWVTYSYGSPKLSRFSWRRKTILVAARRETWQFWSRRELHFSLLDERLSILVATCCYEAPQDLLISGRQTRQRWRCWVLFIYINVSCFHSSDGFSS